MPLSPARQDCCTLTVSAQSLASGRRTEWDFKLRSNELLALSSCEERFLHRIGLRLGPYLPIHLTAWLASVIEVLVAPRHGRKFRCMLEKEMLLRCGSARGKLEAVDYRYFKHYVVNLQLLRVSGRHGNLCAQGSPWVCRNAWNMPVICRCFPTQDHCHYQGYVEGILDSVVAVSTCSGLR